MQAAFCVCRWLNLLLRTLYSVARQLSAKRLIQQKHMLQHYKEQLQRKPTAVFQRAERKLCEWEQSSLHCACIQAPTTDQITQNKNTDQITKNTSNLQKLSQMSRRPSRWPALGVQPSFNHYCTTIAPKFTKAPPLFSAIVSNQGNYIELAQSPKNRFSRPPLVVLSVGCKYS
jgi:hypothetical protein